MDDTTNALSAIALVRAFRNRSHEDFYAIIEGLSVNEVMLLLETVTGMVVTLITGMAKVDAANQGHPDDYAEFVDIFLDNTTRVTIEGLDPDS
jgi:hypothetical protein